MRPGSGARVARRRKTPQHEHRQARPAQFRRYRRPARPGGRLWQLGTLRVCGSAALRSSGKTAGRRRSQPERITKGQRLAEQMSTHRVFIRRPRGSHPAKSLYVSARRLLVLYGFGTAAAMPAYAWPNFFPEPVANPTFDVLGARRHELPAHQVQAALAGLGLVADRGRGSVGTTFQLGVREITAWQISMRTRCGNYAMCGS